jgi:hypothetical protein
VVASPIASAAFVAPDMAPATTHDRDALRLANQHALGRNLWAVVYGKLGRMGPRSASASVATSSAATNMSGMSIEDHGRADARVLAKRRDRNPPLRALDAHLRTWSGRSYFAPSLLQWLAVCSPVNGLSTTSSRRRPGNVSIRRAVPYARPKRPAHLVAVRKVDFWSLSAWQVSMWLDDARSSSCSGASNRRRSSSGS